MRPKNPGKEKRKKEKKRKEKEGSTSSTKEPTNEKGKKIVLT